MASFSFDREKVIGDILTIILECVSVNEDDKDCSCLEAFLQEMRNFLEDKNDSMLQGIYNQYLIVKKKNTRRN